MAVGEKIKIFKIASEINIGRDAIVEFLQNKGFDIQNKPTATLTPEMVELVYEKFKREKIAAEKQREKLEKHHIIHTTESKIEKEPEKEPEKEVEVKESEKPILKETKILAKESLPVAEAKTPSFSQKETVDKQEIITESKVDFIPEPVQQKTEILEGKPDIANKMENKVENKSENKEQESTIEKTEKSEVIVSDKVEQTTREIPKDSKQQVPEAKYRENTTTTPKIASDKQQKPYDKQAKFDRRTDQPRKDEDRRNYQDNRQLDNREPNERHKKKRHKVVEVVPGEAPKLKGLTIVGKIDLNKSKRDDRSKGPSYDKNKNRNQNDRNFRPRDNQDDKRKDIKRTDRDFSKPREDRRPVVQPNPLPSSPIKPFVREKDKIIKVKDKVKHKEEKFAKKHKKAIREQITDAEVDKAVKETMAGIEVAQKGQSRAKIKQKRKLEREEKAEIRQKEFQERANILELTEYVTTAELARFMGVNANQIIAKCITLGLMVTINQRLDKDTIILIAEDFGYKVDFVDEQSTQNLNLEEEELEENLELRPPIVTIMGHVDHGKTSLLDYIRSANVVAGEAGGITQHIGAYQVETKEGRLITFLDTPGHAAFTAMRARGAQVTDIVVLVVAADDSVMPQTIEAISHAKAAGVPLIVAINKIDKPDANPDRIKQQLTDYGILVEDWGGKNQSVEISAKYGQNVDILLDKILIESELLDLKANPDRKASGTVIETVIKKGYGPVATIIVQKGSLRVGEPFVAGTAHGKVRKMLDERDNKVDIATPSTPVLIVGFANLPEAGDSFFVANSDIEARNIAQERSRLKREQEMRQIRRISLDDISQRIQQGNVKELKLILKGDVSGSVEALKDSLEKLSNDEVRVQIIHKGVGSILETDVILAAASEAVIIGFNVSVDANARKLADAEKVDIRLYNIIYDCINEIFLALEGLLTPEYQEETTAIVEVRQLFKISRMGTIAGCYVVNGKISKNDKVKVLRDGLILHTGNISSLKREKDDAREVDTGYECGIMVSNFNSLEIGDIIEAFKINEIKRKLK